MRVITSVDLYLEALRRYYNWPYHGMACETYITLADLSAHQVEMADGQRQLRNRQHGRAYRAL